jgi:hypothetical protein
MNRDEAVRYASAEFNQTFYDALNALMAKVDARARAEEREACARLCEEHKALRLAEMIRAGAGM